jgi:hypothetical protein
MPSPDPIDPRVDEVISRVLDLCPTCSHPWSSHITGEFIPGGSFCLESVHISYPHTRDVACCIAHHYVTSGVPEQCPLKYKK